MVSSSKSASLRSEVQMQECSDVEKRRIRDAVSRIKQGFKARIGVMWRANRGTSVDKSEEANGISF